jgi:PST family polysaccharide transporter
VTSVDQKPVSKCVRFTSGIWMAVAGMGAWSLVGQQLITVAVTNIGILVLARWRPGFSYSLGYAKRLGGFGAHVSASQMVSALGEQALNFLVGILFGSTVLGHFAVAWRLVQLLRSLIGAAVYQVAFSAFARLQDNRPAFIRAFAESTRISCFIGFPIAAGMVLVAEPGLLTVFGQKWANSIPLFSLLALELLPAFFTMFFTAAYRAANYPGWVLVMASVYLATGLAAVAVASPFGILAVCAAWTVRGFLLLPLHLYLLKRLIGIPPLDLLASTIRPAIATAIMCALVGAASVLSDGRMQSVTQLVLFIAIGSLGYALTASLIAPQDMRRRLFGALSSLLGIQARQRV